MKNYTAIIALALALPAGLAIAQPPEGRPPGPPPGEGRPLPDRPPGGPGHERPPVPPVIAALDKNGDGVISDDEITGAADALRKLANEHGGKLAVEHLIGPPPPMGEGLRGPREGRGDRSGPPPGAPRDGAPDLETRTHVLVTKLHDALREFEGPHEGAARDRAMPRSERLRDGALPPPREGFGPPPGGPRDGALRPEARGPRDGAPGPEGFRPRDGERRRDLDGPPRGAVPPGPRGELPPGPPPPRGERSPGDRPEPPPRGERPPGPPPGERPPGDINN